MCKLTSLVTIMSVKFEGSCKCSLYLVVLFDRYLILHVILLLLEQNKMNE